MNQSKLDLKALFRYMSYWPRYPGMLAVSVLFSLTLALQQIVLPLVTAVALGNYIHSGQLNVGLLIFGGCFQFSVVGISYITDKLSILKLHHRVEIDLYNDAFNYLVHQDYSFFANSFSGSLVTQASRFAKSYTLFHDLVFFEIIPQVTTVLVTMAIMAHYSLPIAGVVFVLWLVAICLVVIFGLKRMPIRRAAVAKESVQVGELADMIGNAVTVKTFAAEDREIARYQKINYDRSEYFVRSWSRAVRNVWTVEVLCVVLILSVLFGGLFSVKSGAIGVATFLLFQVYMLRIIENIRRSSMIVRQIEVISGDAQEMTELLEQPPLIQDETAAGSPTISKGAVSFNNVGFHYEDANSSGEPLLENFSLNIGAGQKIGLVGPSGGGKTTITRLLLRFMELQDGSITIDGHNIASIKQQVLRRAIAYVPQEPLLFHRSIKENISYGKPGAGDDEIISVAKKAYAHDFIAELPEGYDTLVGERGVKLSGGQRQRVAIARAMLTEAPILVLDEATSALDSESEVLIQKALWELMKGKTAVVIAHRLSTIQRMDRIVVIENGTIIEDGSHQSLLKHKGLYAKLWKHQSGGFLEE